MRMVFDPPIRLGLRLAAGLLPMVCILPLAAQVMQRKVPAPAPAPTQVIQPPPPAKAPVPNTGVAKLNNGAINTAVQPAPATVNFGSVFSGDSRRATVKVVVPREGRVTFMLAPNTPFSIAEVKVFGLPETPSMRPVPNQAQKQSTASQVKAPAGSGPAPTVALNYSHSLLAMSTSAPFAVAAREGNELVVSLVFAPKFDLMSGPRVGDHQAALRIDGGLWRTSVPVSGRFEGLKIGMIAVMSNPDLTVFTDRSGALSDAELVLTNTDKQLVSAQISAKRLPPGFALTPLAVQVPPGQARKVPLPIHANGGMREGAQQAAELTVSSSGTTKTVPFTFSVYPASKQIHYAGVDGLEWEFWMTISPSGHTSYSYRVKNPNYLLNRRFMFEVKWKGMRLNTMGHDIGHTGPGGSYSGDVVPYSWSIQNNLVRDNYVFMLQLAPTVSMTYENL